MDLDFHEIAIILKIYSVSEAYLFGSYLQNPQDARDIDIAVSLSDMSKLFPLAAKLESCMPKTVDIFPLEVEDRFSQHIRTRGLKIYG
jgi:predicted nucleotidyltransferase